MIDTPPTLDELRSAFESVYNDLTPAFWAASTMEAKDRIYAAEEMVEAILTFLDRADIESRDDILQEATQEIGPHLGKLAKLQADVDDIIHAVAVAGKLASSLGKALGLATKYFA